MKKCAKCKKEKEYSEFAFKNKEKEWLQPYCRSCQKEYRKNHYEQNKAKYLDLIYKRREDIRQQYKKWKSLQECSLCGENEAVCLDFHHELDNKERNVSELINYGRSWKSIKKEIDKCIVVCSNCHRKIHAGLV